jgi:hypothetical protein
MMPDLEQRRRGYPVVRQQRALTGSLCVSLENLPSLAERDPAQRR